MILKFKLLGSSVDAWEAPLEPVLLLVFRVLTNSKNKQFLQILVLLYLLTKFTIEPKKEEYFFSLYFENKNALYVFYEP
jgi:hypothetical protein